jgi:hypothetical protein
MGIDDKRYLIETYKEKLGKATITSYCIKFRTTKGVDMDILEEIFADAMNRRPESGL